jgi:hypothetical protein
MTVVVDGVATESSAFLKKIAAIGAHDGYPYG